MFVYTHACVLRRSPCSLSSYVDSFVNSFMRFVSLLSGIALESANDAYFSPERTEWERAASDHA